MICIALGIARGIARGIRMQYANKYVQYAKYAKWTICIICNLICKIISKKNVNVMHHRQNMTLFTISRKRCKTIC